jgi:hypothetical protein
MPLYKLGRWNGKVNLFDPKNGKLLVRLLGEACEFIDAWGYDVKIDDQRKPIPVVKTRVTEEWFHNRGLKITVSLRPYQVEAINLALDAQSGILEMATGAGKTITVAALCDALNKDSNLRTIVVVPSSDLVDQTRTTFELVGLDVGTYSGAAKDTEHAHVIATWQALQNNPQVLKQFGTVVVDECFAGDQLVLTSTGYQRIDKINVGDLVLSRQDNALVFNEVERVLVKPALSPMLELRFDTGAKIKVTADHEFYTTQGKVRAKDLTADHEIISFGNARDAMTIAKVNAVLSSANQHLRIISVASAPAYGQKILSATLNNGRVLTAVEYRQFVRRALTTELTASFDRLYSSDINDAKLALVAHISLTRSNNGKLAKGVSQKRTRAPWNKGIPSGCIPWNKHQTKHTDPRLLELSVARSGDGNHQFGKPIPAQQAAKQSATIKQAIADGKFTPNVHNSRTANRKSTFNGTGFRSSWEALFWSCNQHLVFESAKHRKILDDGSVFIPDFVDIAAEIVYEVKPKSKIGGSKAERGLQKFSELGWTAVFITEDVLKKLYTICDRTGFDQDTLRRLDNSFGKLSCA